jgi:hypothetical protein
VAWRLPTRRGTPTGWSSLKTNAPLDNNIAERAFKMAVRHRKNSLCYKTLNGARIGDIRMSLIHTCELNGVSPFDDYMALDQHAKAVAKAPTCWFPWKQWGARIW